MTENPTAIRPPYAVKTWADGFGIWHASITISAPGSWQALAMEKARAAIAQEIRERGNADTEAFLASDRFAIEPDGDPEATTSVVSGDKGTIYRFREVDVLDPPDAFTPGSVSTGTLREVDLIPVFIDTLNQLNPQRAGELSEDVRVAMNALDVTYSGDPEYTPEQVEAIIADHVPALVNDLHDALGAAAPAGYRFGAHEGDGADFGFWPDEDPED